MLMKLFYGIVATLCMLFMIAVIFLGLFTPHKTKYGYFTDPYKYWTDEAYVCQNFSVKCENNRIVKK